MPARQRRSIPAKDPSILRAAADELGITTPKTSKRPQRKPPIRVKVYKGQQR